jgi:dCTP deaminase
MRPRHERKYSHRGRLPLPHNKGVRLSLLTGPAIEYHIQSGDIVIEPFDPVQLNPNSYDVRLGPTLLTYTMTLSDSPTLDVRKNNPTIEVPIPEDGIVLEPGILYLGSTVERIGSNKDAGVVEGKSSLGRLGLTTHVTAGFIDCGFLGRITLEITVVHPLRIYAGMRIGQICFTTLEGPIALYKGKYAASTGVVASRSWMDYAPGLSESEKKKDD